MGTSIERSIAVKIKCEPTELEIITTNTSTSSVSKAPKKSATKRINDKTLAAEQARADALGKEIENLADEMDRKESPLDDKSDSQERLKEEANTTVIQQQTNVVQNGDNNINLTNNGTINIKF